MMMRMVIGVMGFVGGLAFSAAAQQVTSERQVDVTKSIVELPQVLQTVQGYVRAACYVADADGKWVPMRLEQR